MKIKSFSTGSTENKTVAEKDTKANRTQENTGRCVAKQARSFGNRNYPYLSGGIINFAT
jgi:hypothetical protein